MGERNTPTPTEYFRIKTDQPDSSEVKGHYNGELLNEEGTFRLHLAPGFDAPEGTIGRRLAREGNGDIVIEKISRAGWLKICSAVSSLGVEATGDQIKEKLTRLPWLTWDQPGNGN